eukprot:gene5117-6368_t
MIEVVCSDRLGTKVRVKVNEDDTIGDLKIVLSAQIGIRPEKIRIQKYYTVYKDPEKLDSADPLKSFRDQFHIPKVNNFIKKDEENTVSTTNQDSKDCIYFVGNSLGLQPKLIKQELNNYLDSWSRYAVEGHHRGEHPFLHIDEEVQDGLSKIVGCLPTEVCPMNTLSVNLHVLLAYFYRPKGQKCKIVIEYGAFPSDLYVAESQLVFNGFKPDEDLIKIKPRDGEETLRTEDIVKVLTDNKDTIALVMLSGVQYYTGQYFNIEEITKVGHEIGAMVGWDLAHAAGNIPLELHDWNVDFATWCSYKYMNSGPGCISAIFVHESHTNQFDLKTDHRLRGWFGNKLSQRFNKEKDFIAEDGALGFRCSNPSVADCTALRTSVNLINSAGIFRMRQKSILLTGYLEYLLLNNQNNVKSENGEIKIITPTDENQRGCQLSLHIKLKNITAPQLKLKLIENGVISDNCSNSTL